MLTSIPTPTLQACHVKATCGRSVLRFQRAAESGKATIKYMNALHNEVTPVEGGTLRQCSQMQVTNCVSLAPHTDGYEVCNQCQVPLTFRPFDPSASSGSDLSTKAFLIKGRVFDKDRHCLIFTKDKFADAAGDAGSFAIDTYIPNDH